MSLIAETNFGLSLLAQSVGNVSMVFSPLSIAMALSLVYAGAKDKTKSQIGDVILKGGNVVDYYSEVQEGFLNASNGVEVSLANRMYLKNGFTPKSEYLTCIKKDFGALAETLDFVNGAQAAKTVNDFVSGVTKGIIKKVVDANTFKEAIALVVNALYLKAYWLDNFNSGSVLPNKFYSAENKFRQENYLSEFRAQRLYASDKNFQVLSLPYRDTSYSFNVFLPVQKFGLKAQLASLTGDNIQSLLSKLDMTMVNIKIPKMKINTNLDLEPALIKLGIKDVFTNQADLSGIADKIMVSSIVHDAVIDVNEEGTTAAAATVVKMYPMSLTLGEPIDFTADHPFLFILTKDKHPAFMGVFQ